MRPLYVEGLGLVTAVGLDLAQSANAFLAGVAGFAEDLAPDQIDMQIMARVPTDWRLRPNAGEWLLNLAARAGREAMQETTVDPSRTLLLCTPPESYRNHKCWVETTPQRFLSALQDKLGARFAPGSRLIEGGPAGLVGALADVARVLEGGGVTKALVIGVDCLIDAADMRRLRQAERLHGQSAQGVIPGEGAAALILSLTSQSGMAIRAIGNGDEADSVLGERQSQGRGMARALSAVCAQPGCPESAVDFVVSTFNGERYAALESLIFRTRFYRTYRKFLPTVYPAMSFGETGAAAGAVALAVAADAFRRNHAPGKNAMIEVASDNGHRAAAFVSGITP